MNSEVVELAHSKALAELKEAGDKIVQLSAQNARLVGVDTRLANALQEKDDIQQERNSASQRAKIADARVVSLKEKCGTSIACSMTRRTKLSWSFSKVTGSGRQVKGRSRHAEVLPQRTIRGGPY